MIRLEHVVQKPRTKDCAVACIAMIANVSYDEVLATASASIKKRGLRHREILRLLNRFTRTRWQVQDGWFRRLGSILLAKGKRIPGQPLLVWIREPWHWRVGHAVVVFGGWVHDPAFRQPTRWGDYPRADWKVWRIYRPRNPGALDATRLENWVNSNLCIRFPEAQTQE
jgi:hypothetical protein